MEGLFGAFRRDARVMVVGAEASRSLCFGGGFVVSRPSAMKLRMDGAHGTRHSARDFLIFLESYIYCAPKGVNSTQKRAGKIRNGIKWLEIISGLRGLTKKQGQKSRDQGPGTRD